MTDEASYFRAYARDIACDPAVNGQDNVQDALADGGFAVLGAGSADAVNADAATDLTGDGGTHSVHCLIAAPPTWMDNASHITEVGVYNIVADLNVTAGPTTPGLGITLVGPFQALEVASCDLLGSGGEVRVIDVQTVGTADLPFFVNYNIVMPTDATEAVNVTLGVVRLAS